MALLEVSGVSKRFDGLRALDHVDLTVEEGSIHSIIGPNGAGKSTLLNVLTGSLQPDQGGVRFDGTSLVGRPPYAINQLGIARVFQTPAIFPELSLLDNVMIAALAARDGSFRLEPARASAKARRGPGAGGRGARERRPRAAARDRGAASVARRQAAARARDLPRAPAAAAAARRADRRHVAQRDPCDGRASAQDLGDRHDQGHHRARHGRRLQPVRRGSPCSTRAG